MLIFNVHYVKTILYYKLVSNYKIKTCIEVFKGQL